MSNTQTVYRYDAKGYYIGTSLAQLLNNELLLPSDCTKEKPTLKDGYWTRWNGSKWTDEKIPTSCVECIEQGLTCISNGTGEHNYQVKILLESLVSADQEHYKIVVSSDFVEQIEEIPEPTEEEKQQKEDEEKDQALEQAIDELGKEMLKAQMCENKEWIAEIKAQYQTLMSGDEE